MSLPILFSIPSDNGEYQLFGPVDDPIPNVSEQRIYEISKSEMINIRKKTVLVQLSTIIETYLESNKEDSYNLTKYTLSIIDEVECEIFVYLDYHENPYNYYYKIFAKNIEYESNGSLEKDFLLYESACFTNVFFLLENIKKVEHTYKLLDYYLLSPEKMLEAKTQRAFIPIHSDKVCSVCYDSTLEYTICKHSICLKCRDKCIVQGKTTCPICRGSNLSIYPNTL